MQQSVDTISIQWISNLDLYNDRIFGRDTDSDTSILLIKESSKRAKSHQQSSNPL